LRAEAQQGQIQQLINTVAQLQGGQRRDDLRLQQTFGPDLSGLCTPVLPSLRHQQTFGPDLAGLCTPVLLSDEGLKSVEQGCDVKVTIPVRGLEKGIELTVWRRASRREGNQHGVAFNHPGLARCKQCQENYKRRHGYPRNFVTFIVGLDSNGTPACYHLPNTRSLYHELKGGDGNDLPRQQAQPPRVHLARGSAPSQVVFQPGGAMTLVHVLPVAALAALTSSWSSLLGHARTNLSHAPPYFLQTLLRPPATTAPALWSIFTTNACPPNRH